MFQRVVVLCGVLLCGFVVLAQRPPESPVSSNLDSKTLAVPPEKQTPRGKRFREGTTFKDKIVFFRQAGDRTALYMVEDNQRFFCHENLAPERILTTTQKNPERELWKIEGTFSEFRGENFITIRRAVVAPRPVLFVP